MNIIDKIVQISLFLRKIDEYLQRFKPIHLCWLFEKLGLPIPRYFVGIVYGSDFCNGGTATSNSVEGSQYASKAFDNNTGTRWESVYGVLPVWLKYDLGVGVTRQAFKLRMKPEAASPNAFKLQGSNNDSDWDDLLSSNCDGSQNWQEWTFNNTTAYRYYQIYVTTKYLAYGVSLWEVEMMEKDPLAPSNCVSSYVATNNAKCTWTDNSNNEHGFRIEKDIDGAGFSFWKDVEAGIEDSGTYTLGANHRIRFRVRSYNDVGYSTWSTGGYTYTTPTAPSSCLIALGTINVTWTDNSAYEEGFQVDRQLDGGGWNLVHTTAAEAESWPDTSQPTGANVKYEYRVRAKKGSLYSTYSTSNVIFAKTCSETINLSDTYSRICNWFRTFIESITLTDTLQKKPAKTFTESLTLADTLQKKPAKTFIEAITLNDIYSRAWTIYRTFTESITITDTVRKAISKTFSELISLSDSLVKKVAKTFTEKITLTDTVRKVKSNLVQLLKKLMNLFDIKG